MVRGKRILLLLSVLFIALTVYAVQTVHDVKTAYLPITDAGDTAKVMKVHKFSAMDSGVYNLDIEGGVITGSDSAVTWVSPLQKMVLTPVADSVFDSAIFEDTIIFASTSRLGVRWVSPLQVGRINVTSPIDTTTVYTCSLDMGTNVYGFTYDPPSTDTTLATFIDSLVDSINAVAGMTDSVLAEDSTANGNIKVIGKFATDNLEGGARWQLRVTGSEIAIGDSTITTVAMWADSIAALIEAETNLTDSVTAHDSATYVLITSLFSSDTYGGRWTLKSSAGNQDTASHASITTIAMVVDSMVATANGVDSIAAHYTAANDGDTVWTITALKKGLNFTLDIADTSQDSSTIQDTVTSRSGNTDTIKHIVGLHRRDLHAGGLYMTVILKPSADTGDGGIGKDDSAVIWVYTVFDDQSTTGQYFLLDSSVSEGLPDTLRISIPRDSAGVDTLFKDWLAIVYRLDDSTTDTTFWPSYDVQIDLNVYEQ
jgi:hypothetical protein